MSKKNITFEQFVKKAQQKFKNRKLIAEIMVESLGCEIPFQRPDDNELLDYIGQITQVIKTDNDGNVSVSDFKQMYDASKTLVYSNCAYLKNQELHDSLEVKEPLEVISILFDMEEVIEIAKQIYEEFSGKKIHENIKN